jgi:hypothetical protein
LSLGKSESAYAAREFGQRLFFDIGNGTRTVREPYEVTKVRLDLYCLLLNRTHAERAVILVARHARFIRNPLLSEWPGRQARKET